MIERYKYHTIALQPDGSYSVHHPIYEHVANCKTVEECKSLIDLKEAEANRRVALSMAFTMSER